MLTRTLIIFALTATLARAQPTPESPSPDLDPAIARGLAYLARQQQPDGSFLNRDKDSKPATFSGKRIALTGLSLMAYLAAGRMPDTGKHGFAVKSAIEYLLKACPDDGYYGKVDGSQMYGHAIATLALAEAYGTAEADPAQRARLRAALAKAVAVLLRAQDSKKADPFRGGWRYEIASPDADCSVTGWCILALRAAQNAGVDVPKSSADRAAAFVLRCYRPDPKAFAYQPGGEPSLTMTASAALDLQLLDRGTRPEVLAAAKYLDAHPLADDNAEYPYYARYYTTQAAYQFGGKLWPKIWDQTQSKLLKLQDRQGHWPPSRSAKEPGQTYSTAMSVLTLSIPLRLLPTYQR